MSLFTELKRRNVFRVGIAYLLGAWVLLQGADFALDVIGAPNWIIQALTVLAMIGLPAVLVFSWVFEMTPEGLKRESEVDRTQSITHHTGHKLNYVIIATLVLIIVIMGAERLFLVQEPTPAAGQPIATEPGAAEQPPKSVAVLPFADLSQAGDQVWFADGLAEEILNALARTPDLLVSSRTASFRYRDSQQELSQIAAELGVAHILEGSVRSSGDRIRVTAQLIRASDGFHIWSENYDRDVADMITIQEDLARSIARALETTMDPDALAAMTRVGTQSVEAYQAMLRGMALEASALDSFQGQPLLDSLDQFEKARSADPGFAYAHMRVAAWWKQQKSPNFTGSNLTGLGPTEMQERFDEAIGEAIDHAPTELDRKGYQALEAEVNLRFRQALRLYSEYLDARPQESTAWLGLLNVASVMNDREVLAWVFDHTRETGLRDPFYATLYVGDAYKHRDPGAVADYGLAALERWPTHTGLLYQTHRALMWAGRAQEGAEVRRRYLSGNDPNPVMELRQACIEGRVADAESILASLTPGSMPTWRSNRWLMLLMMNRRDEATELVRYFDTEASAYELTGFMSYTVFDARPFRSLELMMQREGIRRPPPVDMPYKCPPPSPPSVAVLPFVNMSADPDNEYFSDGISEELLNLLVRIDGLRVPSRTSSFAFKGLNTDIREIARQLDVGHILEGSVRKAGNKVRVTAQLIDVSTDTHLWSETYDRELEDIFAIQDEISGHIVRELQLALAPAARKPTDNLEAYNLFLQGRYLAQQRGPGLRDAEALLKRAIELDPNFAEAWGALSLTYALFPYYLGMPAEEMAPALMQAAERALALDPDLADPNLAIAHNKVRDQDWLSAFSIYESVISKHPANSLARLWFGIDLFKAGYIAEAADQLAASVDLDPVSGINLDWHARVLASQGKMEAALSEARKALKLGRTQAQFPVYLMALEPGKEGVLEEMRPDLPPTFEAQFGPLLRLAHDPGGKEEALEAIEQRVTRPNLPNPSKYGRMNTFHAAHDAEGYTEAMSDVLSFDNSVSTVMWFPASTWFRPSASMKQWVAEMGLVELWKKRGWPDLCRPTTGDDFECE